MSYLYNRNKYKTPSREGDPGDKHLSHCRVLNVAPFCITDGCGWSQRVKSLVHTLDTLCSCDPSIYHRTAKTVTHPHLKQLVAPVDLPLS